MPELSLGTDGSFARTIGVMLFPGSGQEEQEKAKAVAATVLSGGMRHAGDAVGQFPDQVFRMIVELDAGTSLGESELKRRYADGVTAGELVKLYFGLARQRPKLASWENAVRCLEKGLNTSSRSSFKEAQKRVLPASHLWGAWVLRGQGLHAQPAIGYGAHDDFETFIEEAMALLAWGTEWRHTRAKSKTPFPVDTMLRAPVGWRRERWLLGWPTIWDTLEYDLPGDLLSELKPAGNPGKSASKSDKPVGKSGKPARRSG